MWLRGADFRVRLTSDSGQVFVGCERIGLQRASEPREVSNTEGRPGNPGMPDEPRTSAFIGDILQLRITLVQPSFDPSNNIWASLVLAPGDYCQVEITSADMLGIATGGTGVMNCLYHQDNVEAQIPGKAPATMLFIGDGVSTSVMSLLNGR